MKSHSRLWALGVAGSCLLWSVGCARTQLVAEEVPVHPEGQKTAEAAPATSAVAGTPAVPAPPQTGAPENSSPTAEVDSIAGNTAATNVVPEKPALAESGTNVAPVEVKLVQAPKPPGHLQLSPGLAEVVKLVQAGVNDEVILAYVESTTNVYHLGSDELVYLNDLGVAKEVVTALIKKDNSPEAMDQKRAEQAVSPLPPGFALNTPAPDLYTTSAKPALTPAPEQVAATVPASNAEPAPLAAPVEAPSVEGAAAYYYDSLAPYGNWIYVSNYGWCWQPTVARANARWRPYADQGRWLWTDAGWYWYSDYSWGWAPFHYGRWCTAPNYGWMWVPDTCWGPSWVTWRYNSYYCGWAPLPPSCYYSSGVGLVYGGAAISIGFGFGFGCYDYTWIPWHGFCDYYPSRYYAYGSHASVIYRDSAAVNNYIVGDNNTIINNGFGVEQAARRTRGEIQRVPIRSEPLSANPSERAERLVAQGSRSAVVRPELPSQPPLRAGAGAGSGGGGVSGSPVVRAESGSGRHTAVANPAAATSRPEAAPALQGGASTLAPETSAKSGRARARGQPVPVQNAAAGERATVSGRSTTAAASGKASPEATATASTGTRVQSPRGSFSTPPTAARAGTSASPSQSATRGQRTVVRPQSSDSGAAPSASPSAPGNATIVRQSRASFIAPKSTITSGAPARGAGELGGAPGSVARPQAVTSAPSSVTGGGSSGSRSAIRVYPDSRVSRPPVSSSPVVPSNPVRSAPVLRSSPSSISVPRTVSPPSSSYIRPSMPQGSAPTIRSAPSQAFTRSAPSMSSGSGGGSISRPSISAPARSSAPSTPSGSGHMSRGAGRGR